MKLTKSQKKQLKRCIKEKGIEKISEEMKIPVRDIEKHLLEIWGKDKYNKFKSDREQKQLTKEEGHSDKYFILFLIILILICYGKFLGHEFVSDDITNIVTASNINSIKYALGGFGLNLRNLIIFLINKAAGLNPAYYRGTNILFHIGCTILIYRIVTQLVSKETGKITALIFAVHPILSEAVIWVSGGVYVYSSFFTLLSIFLYINREKNKKFYNLSIISFIFSFLNLVQAAALAPIFSIYEYSKSTLKKNFKPALVYNAILLISVPWYFILARQRAMSLQTDFYQERTGSNPLIQIPTAIGEYIKLIFWPRNLTLYHTELSFTPLAYAINLSIFTCLILLTIFLYRKNRKMVFWPLLFLIALSPTLTPLGISWIVAERYVYLASVGIFVLVAWALELATKKLFGQRCIKWLYIILAIMILPLSLRTISRNKDWKSHDTLWLATAKFSPSSPQNHNNLGDYYIRHKQYDKAVEEFIKAIELKPGYADAYHNLANTYTETGDVENAIKNYEEAIKYNPKLWQSYQNLGVMYYHLGDKEKAQSYIEKSLEINPNNGDLKKALDYISTQP